MRSDCIDGNRFHSYKTHYLCSKCGIKIRTHRIHYFDMNLSGVIQALCSSTTGNYHPVYLITSIVEDVDCLMCISEKNILKRKLYFYREERRIENLIQLDAFVMTIERDKMGRSK